MPLAIIPFALLIIPVLEIAVFILIGNQIGLWPTLLMIVVTAILGTILLRHQGFQLLSEIRAKTKAGEIPGRALVHGVMLLVAGILLLTPGFVTDTFGFLLFLPPARDSLWQFLRTRINFEVITPKHHQNTNPEMASKGPTIDLDETEFGPSDPDSPWNKN